MSSSDPFAISTTFTPPATCTQTHLSLLEDDQYRIWLNYPEPVSSSTVTDCYPSAFISSYLSSQALVAQGITTPLPAITPLICPVGYGTELSTVISGSQYIACCPSSWGLASPTTNIISTRPAAGGTCYSAISTVVVTAYNNSTVTATSTWVASSSGAQAYALVIEGYAAANATSGNGIFASSTSSSPITATTTVLSTLTTSPAPTVSLAPTFSASKKGLSGGAIAGIVIGCVAGVLLLLAAAILFLRKRRQARRSATTTTAESGHGRQKSELDAGADGQQFQESKEPKVMPFGAGENGTDSHTELPGYTAPHEVESPGNVPQEMQGEGYIDASTADRVGGSAAGPHEMDGGN